MAEQNNLLQVIESVKLEAGTHWATNYIKNCNGDSREIKSWLNSLEKYAIVVGADRDRLKKLAYQTATGPLSNYIESFMSSLPDASWGDLKTQIKTRFGEIVDKSHALKLLRKIKQKPHEGIQSYAERIAELARDAFPEADLNQPAYSDQLIEIFTDGLTSNIVVKKVIRSKPATISDAVDTAQREYNFNKQFEVRHRQDETMEIDKFDGVCFNCHNPGHRAQECKMNKSSTQFNGICYNCNRRGHRQRDCAVVNNRTNPNRSRFQSNNTQRSSQGRGHINPNRQRDTNQFSRPGGRNQPNRQGGTNPQNRQGQFRPRQGQQTRYVRHVQYEDDTHDNAYTHEQGDLN